jgi:nucleotide-binding universal stress UspA family protein
MYQTILLAAALQRWDRYSVHALAARDLAAAVARNTSTALHVLSVYQHESPRVLRDNVPPDAVRRFIASEIQRVDALMLQKIDEYVAPLRAQGLQVSKILRVGHARDVIVQVAAEIKADLLVIGSHSKRSLLDIAVGGTSQHVARHAPCTVVLVSPKR